MGLKTNNVCQDQQCVSRPAMGVKNTPHGGKWRPMSSPFASSQIINQSSLSSFPAGPSVDLNAPKESNQQPSMPPGSFFSQYPDFDHDPTAPLVREFQRLSLQQGWKEDGKKYRRNRQNCFAQEFEYHYGHASDKLAGWQSLCEEVYISPIPSSIRQCKKALSHVAVNLVDLIDSRRTGKKVKLFPSKSALRNYSKQQKKIFPKHKAKADGFLSALLIEIF